MSKLSIGLFGFGVVGEGIYQVVESKPEFNAEIKRVVVKHPDKKRSAPAQLFSTQAADILDDGSIQLVVELISDADAAFDIVMKAFKNGKSVISANKKMIAEHHLELIEASQRNNVSFLYEGAVCGSVPIIRNLEEYFDNDLLESISGIVNGSTNYILSKMYDSGEPFLQALEAAQLNGFAEADAQLDVDGSDAGFKLSIMALHGFGQLLSPTNIIRKGITSLSPADFKYAKEKNQVIKLLAECITNSEGNIAAISVLPSFLPADSALGRTNNEYNGVVVKSSLADEQFLFGKGAGRFPTSSAVLSDISAFKYGYRYAYKKGVRPAKIPSDCQLNVYVSRPPNITVNLEVFSEVLSDYRDASIQVTTGRLSLRQLQQSGLLENADVSVVRLFNN